MTTSIGNLIVRISNLSLLVVHRLYFSIYVLCNVFSLPLGGGGDVASHPYVAGLRALSLLGNNVLVFLRLRKNHEEFPLSIGRLHM